jgi:hypothetical protein
VTIRRIIFLAAAATTLALAVSTASCERATGETPRSSNGPIDAAIPDPCSLAVPPPTLADTGLYADFATKRLRADVLPFAPQYPLWSDGASKRRWIHLPPGTSIDASDPDHWKFPAGTKLWKEFSFQRRVETRYLELLADGRWLRATYEWSADESAAPLAPELGVSRACEHRPGAHFDIPSRMDCAACHDAGPNAVLGFGALQLSSDRDPLAPHAEPPPEGAVDLDDLVERGLVRGLPASVTDEPPRVAASSPRERAALGYLHANCGMCHNSSGPLASLGMDLEQSVTRGGAALATTLGRKSRFQSGGEREDQRLVAGEPEQSLLRRRMASRNPLLQMPPLGTRLVDPDALALLTDWIREDVRAAPNQKN